MTYTSPHKYTEDELLEATIADLKTDIECAKRDGLDAYAKECEARLRRIKMKIIAVIPARAGSRGVRNKNTRIVAGLPLWMWTYRAALAAECLHEIIITTDIEDILYHPPMQSKATVIKRPPELATDDASLDSVIVHAAAELDRLVVVLQPTVPVRVPGLIDGCVREFLRGGFNSLVTVNPLHVVWRGGSEKGGAEPVAPRVDRQKIRADDMLYEEDGSVFIVHSDNLRDTGTRVIQPVLLLHNERTVDIDTENDLMLAERLIMGQRDFKLGVFL